MRTEGGFEKTKKTKKKLDEVGAGEKRREKGDKRGGRRRRSDRAELEELKAQSPEGLGKEVVPEEEVPVVEVPEVPKAPEILDVEASRVEESQIVGSKSSARLFAEDEPPMASEEEAKAAGEGEDPVALLLQHVDRMLGGDKEGSSVPMPAKDKDSDTDKPAKARVYEMPLSKMKFAPPTHFVESKEPEAADPGFEDNGEPTEAFSGLLKDFNDILETLFDGEAKKKWEKFSPEKRKELLEWLKELVENFNYYLSYNKEYPARAKVLSIIMNEWQEKRGKSSDVGEFLSLLNTLIRHGQDYSGLQSEEWLPKEKEERAKVQVIAAEETELTDEEFEAVGQRYKKDTGKPLSEDKEDTRRQDATGGGKKDEEGGIEALKGQAREKMARIKELAEEKIAILKGTEGDYLKQASRMERRLRAYLADGEKYLGRCKEGNKDAKELPDFIGKELPEDIARAEKELSDLKGEMQKLEELKGKAREGIGHMKKTAGIIVAMLKEMGGEDAEQALVAEKKIAKYVEDNESFLNRCKPGSSSAKDLTAFVEKEVPADIINIDRQLGVLQGRKRIADAKVLKETEESAQEKLARETREAHKELVQIGKKEGKGSAEYAAALEKWRDLKDELTKVGEASVEVSPRTVAPAVDRVDSAVGANEQKFTALDQVEEFIRGKQKNLREFDEKIAGLEKQKKGLPSAFHSGMNKDIEVLDGQADPIRQELERYKNAEEMFQELSVLEDRLADQKKLNVPQRFYQNVLDEIESTKGRIVEFMNKQTE